MVQNLPVETVSKGWGWSHLAKSLFAPVDAASIVVFRISFGLVIAWLGIDYIVVGRAYELYVKPDFHFSYYGFDWVEPFPLYGMKLFFLTMSLLGLCVAVGLMYRVTAPLLAIVFTYFFLLDRTNYQNHYYLLTLLAWTMAIIPAHRLWSVDAVLWPSIRSDWSRVWVLWLLRFHVGLPYFFGGVAKLNSDWFAGAPLRQMLASRSEIPLIGPWLTLESVVQGFIWGGLLFDLLIVPLLMWKRTRVVAYLLCVAFHLTNSVVFDTIHVFPWFMILGTTIFFNPDWPRRFLRSAKVPSKKLAKEDSSPPVSVSKVVAIAALMVYCGFHLVWPFAHLLEDGDSSWTERGHHFSWRMMLRGKTSGFRFYVTDPETGKTWNPDVRKWITPDQEIRFVRDPEMILHLAHFIAEDYLKLTGRRFEVSALVMTSLNGRKPQLLIDPQVDLAKEPRGYYRRPWIRPLTEPLRADPWLIPPSEWERSVEVPRLTFLKERGQSVSDAEVHKDGASPNLSPTPAVNALQRR